MGIAYYLLPNKTPAVIIGSLVLIFLLLLQPLWNFWWIEKNLTRRIVSSIILIGLLGYLGALSWPEDKRPGPEIQSLKITGFMPEFDSEGTPIAIRVNYENNIPMRILVKDRHVALDPTVIPSDHVPHKLFEENLWNHEFSRPGEWKPSLIPAIRGSSWRVRLFSDSPGGAEKLKAGWTVYAMGIIAEASGKLLAEYCVHITRYASQVNACMEHNGPI